MSVVDTDAAIEAALDKEMDFSDGEDKTSAPADDKKVQTTTPEDGGQQQPVTETPATTDTGTAPGTQQTKESVPATEAQPVTLQNHPTLREYRIDKDGNVTDASGQVVAAAGRERRWLETSESMRSYITQQRDDNKKLQGRIDEIAASSKDALDGLPSRLGLNTDEVDLGLKLASNFKTDPVATARYILAETMKLGYNLEQIVETTGSNSINMTAIKQLIDEKLEPFTSQQRTEQEAHTTKQNGIDAYNKFMQRFPDAGPHQDMIASIAQQYKLAPEDAYFELRTWAAKKGLDFSQPLQPQLQQRATPPANAPSQTAPLPNGGTIPGAVTNTPPIASEDADYDDIIKDAMRDAGMAVT